MTQRVLTLLEWLRTLVWQFAQLVVQRYRRWHNATYQPDQEHALELKQLTNREIKGLGGYIHWTAGMIGLYYMMILAVLFMFVLSISAALKQEPVGGIVMMMLLLAIHIGVMLLCLPDNAHQCLRHVTGYVWDHPEVQAARQKYSYFYITEQKKIVFTNVKPNCLLCTFTRQRADVDWRAYKNNRVRAALDWAFISTFYLRFVWPFILSPLQLAFLAYRTAMKRVEFKPGMQVLMVGAGPLPYHVWWKAKLGPEGHIVALDIDPYVNKTSRQVETAFEWFRSLFSERRWVSTHVTGDAEELPFAENSFDLVVSIRCYHLNIKEGLRVLKPGGHLLACPSTKIARLDRKTQQVDDSTDWWLVTA